MPIIKNNLDLFITKISKKQTRIPLSSLINFRKKLYSNCSETRFDIMLFSPSCVIIRGCSSEIECSFRMREVRGVQSPVPPLTNGYFILSRHLCWIWCPCYKPSMTLGDLDTELSKVKSFLRGVEQNRHRMPSPSIETSPNKT